MGVFVFVGVLVKLFVGVGVKVNVGVFVLVKVEEDAPIPNAAAQRALATTERFHVSCKGVETHFGESAVDVLTIHRRNVAQGFLGRASDHQAPGHASIRRAG